ncbi:MAG: biosynthetic-type acetolactate synthase large subunit [Ruminococcaceae bacterium]|nr:biosynthetic-type acetolactate synthase large subunit [Oscillospiraceae bacterium]
MLLSGADILVKTLIEQGCNVAFGYPGGQILDVYDSLYKYRDEIEHVLTAHEQGAAHAADGYARTTGKVGVVISTSGPGATNLVTGIATAHMDSVPILAICGNVPTSQIGTDSFQEIDITGITLPITKHNYFVSSVDKLADTVREAFSLAKSGRPGPVLIDIPKDVQTAMGEYTIMPKACPAEAFCAKDVRIEEAAAAINEAERPFIYFGGGINASDATREMLELAELLDAPMACSMMGLSVLPSEHSRFLGMQGMHGKYAASMAMNKADCIIALGVRFNDRVTGDRSKFAKKATLVQIDADGSELSKNIIAQHGLRGDIKATLKKLIPLLNQKKLPDWQADVEKLREEGVRYVDNREGLTPRNAVLAVNEFLGENTAVVTDVGQHQMWAAQNLIFKSPRRFVSSGGLGTMGFGLGAAIGAAYGTKERSVLITGDGSFGMSLNELATAVSYNIPLVAVIMNNGVLGMVRQWQTLFYDKHYSASVLDRKTDFVELAKAFGATGCRVNTLDGLKNALEEAFSTNSVYVIDCSIDKDELVLPMLPPCGSFDDIIMKVD